VIARRIGRGGLWSDLHATMSTATAQRPYAKDFVATARERCFATLPGLQPVD